MGNVARAIQEINEAAQRGDETLSINFRNLDTQDLERLIPMIAEQMPQLKELDLSENGIRAIPESISQLQNLEVLTVEENELESLPQALTQMPNLDTLNLQNNDLREFPEVVLQIPALIHADLSTNKIATFTASQEALSGLGETTIDLTNNRLPAERLLYITENVPDGNIETDLVNQEQVNDVDDVLEAMYPAERVQEVKDAIDNLDTGEYTTAKLRARKRSGKEVLNDFLSKTEFQGDIATQIYLPATRNILDTILNPATPDTEQSTEIQKMATSLGNCATPVKSFQIQNAVDQQLRRGAALTPLMERLLDREAVEDRINSAMEGQLRKTEKIEQVQALVNAITMEGAENNPANKVQILGERERLPSKTAHVDYGFNVISEEQATTFAKLFAVTTPENELVRNAGQYQLDPAKLQSVTSAYRAKLGLISDDERAIKAKTETYKEAVTPLLQHDNLIENYSEPDVEEVLDTLAQQEALRVALFRVPEAQRDAAYEQFLEAQKTKIQQVVEKYEPKKAGLEAMLEPMNQDRRPPSDGEGGGGKRKAAPSSTLTAPQQKRAGRKP